MQSSPYEGGITYKEGNRSAVSYTGGIGIKGGNFFLDLGYSFTKTSGNYAPYTLADGSAPSASVATKINRFMMTFGAKF